jgi:hypothetical protein
MKNIVMAVIVAAVFSLLPAARSNGASLYVTNSTQLQTALDTARTNGEDDTIYLEIGTYTTASGPFTYGTASNDNHAVTLSGGWNHLTPGFQNNYPELTRLDGNDVNPVLVIDSNAVGVAITFIIENLTIENGYARSSDYSGGGILAYTGPAGKGSIDLTIQNCLFQNNNAASNKSGGALYSMGSLAVYDSRFLSNSGSSGGAMLITYDADESASASPIIKNCTFEDNTNYGNQGSSIWTNCATRISGCTFKGRSDGVSSSGPGSCIWGNGGSHINVENSIFSDITIPYWGSAIQVWDGNLDITNCLFSNNHSGVGGDGYGAIAFLRNSSAYTINITNCTFSGNTDLSTSGAIQNRGGTMNLNNCIFWDNDGVTGIVNESGTITMRYCVYDNGSMGYGVTDGGNNAYDNPMFIDDDVFRLGSESPCIDAGNNDLVPADALDVDNDSDTAEAIPLDVQGKARFRDDPYTTETGNGTAPIVDIGAYEYQQVARFGTVNGTKNVKLTLKDTHDSDVTFALAGSGYGTIDPCNPAFDLIEIYNMNDDNEKTALTISTKNKGGSRAGSILCLTPMKSITAKNIGLFGELKISSAMNPKAAVTITFAEGDGLAIDSEMPIKSISTMDWWGSLTAPSVGSITSKRNVASSQYGNLSIDVNVPGVINSVKVAGEIDGTWDCNIVNSIAAFDTDDFYLTLSHQPDPKVPALGKMAIKDDFAWSRILSSGNIGTVTVGEMRHSTCFAGVTAARDVDAADSVYDLPDPDTDIDYNTPATIKSIAVKGIKGQQYCAVNCNVAAANILSISLAYPQNDNGGVPFGVAAGYIKNLTIKDDVGSETMKELDEPGDGGGPYGDAEIRLH